ncbi:enoyl-CoA hydratase-related protein [Thermodesulfobacteriota bacterium]
MKYENVLFEVRDCVGILTLNRPNLLNGLSIPLMTDVLDVLKRVAADPKVHVLVITGAGRGFCAGADLGAAGEHAATEEELGYTPSLGEIISDSMKSHFNPLVREIAELEKPVIAAVNGVAAGGGVGLALAADIVIASRSASFVVVFGPQLGIVPDMGCTWYLPRLVGRARALGLALLGERLPAEKAVEWGLIWDCVDDENLMEHVMRIARRLAQGPTKAYGYIKRAFMQSGFNSLEQQLGFERASQRILCDTDDFKEGITAFLEKREPSFKGY